MKQIYKKRTFVIYRVRDGHIIYNTKKPFSEGHTHVSNYDTAIRIMNIAISKEVPRHLSDYLLESLIRLTDDEDFMIKIENMRKIRKKGKGKDENMSFGEALEAVKHGKKAKREGWNGKNQYIQLATGISYKTAEGEIVNCEHDAIGNKAIAFIGTSGVQMGWLASQADMLAEDWEVVE